MNGQAGTVELRLVPDSAPSVGGQEQNGAKRAELRGYASVFSEWYDIRPGVREQIMPGAFKRTLAESPAVALRIEHDKLPLAHTQTRSLRLSEDRIGLACVADLNANDPDVQSLLAKSENSPLQMSFAFRCQRDRWDDDYSRREVLAADLEQGDISVVCFGANPATSMTVAARSHALTPEQRRSFAQRVKDSGVAGRASTDALSAGWRFEGGHLLVPGATTREPAVSYHAHIKAKAARAKAGRRGDPRAHPGANGRRARLDVHDRPSGKEKYTADEIQKLGEEGMAHKKLRGGGYHFPIADPEDVSHAVKALGRAAPS